MNRKANDSDRSLDQNGGIEYVILFSWQRTPATSGMVVIIFSFQPEQKKGHNTNMTC